MVASMLAKHPSETLSSVSGFGAMIFPNNLVVLLVRLGVEG